MRRVDFTSTGWAAGETVSVFAVPLTPGAPLGDAVDSDAADDTGAATFTALDADVQYVATGGTSNRRALISIRFNAGTTRVDWDGTGDIPARPPWEHVFWVTPSADADPGDNAIDGDSWAVES